MAGVARFFKVSKEVFSQSASRLLPQLTDQEILSAYDSIRLPGRATAGSAGYDFYLPFDLRLKSGQGLTLPTGVRARIQPGWVLVLFPRSGLGFSHRLSLDNTAGIVDGDYFDAENEGHILVRLGNNSRENDDLTLDRGRAFVQGIFLPFGRTTDDAVEKKRTGGFGSTEEDHAQ